MTDVLVYTAASCAHPARGLLMQACRATAIGVRLEVYGSGGLYQRLGPRHGPPLPDVVLWSGPFAAHAAGLDDLLQAHQPARIAEGAIHDPGWRWTTLDYSVIGVIGGTPVGGWPELLNIPKLGMADPERSEAGMAILLASLDRARRAESDIDPLREPDGALREPQDRGWAWWLQRKRAGLALAETDAGAVAMLGDARVAATHVLSQSDERAVPLVGLAPIPNAVGVATNARNPDAARRLVDWLTGETAAAALRLSPWQAESNGLRALMTAAPPLDVDWCRQQYTATRRRWAQSGFGPN